MLYAVSSKSPHEAEQNIQRSSTNSIHDHSADGISNDTDRNPTTLQSKLIPSSVTKALIQFGAIVVDD